MSSISLFLAVMLIISSVFISIPKVPWPADHPSVVNVAPMSLTPELSSIPLQRQGTFWLNFSLMTAGNEVISSFDFQFYITGRDSSYQMEGFAAMLPQGGNVAAGNPFYTYPAINYTEFTNTTALFQSYVYFNGSQPDNAFLFTGPPNYGPASNRYYFLLSSAFPSIRDGVYVAANDSTDGPPYGAWSYWFGASSFQVKFMNGMTYSLPSLSIMVNMTVADVNNNTNTWSFSPSVSITGADYNVSSSYAGIRYMIYTNLGPSSSAAFYIVIVGIIAGAMAAAIAIWIMKRKHNELANTHKEGEIITVGFNSLQPGPKSDGALS
ncbi:MAG: hypothetical protein JRN19_07295 [Nitrososphaerota archaeon]|nr:hypothetical protein [Nitrososphaerota archaeon]MDG7052234.1 hypothetical protein [Nitrososphaerota archaeon]